MSGPRFLWNFMFPYRLIFQWESPGVPTRLLTRDFRKQRQHYAIKKGAASIWLRLPCIRNLVVRSISAR